MALPQLSNTDCILYLSIYPSVVNITVQFEMSQNNSLAVIEYLCNMYCEGAETQESTGNLSCLIVQMQPERLSSMVDAGLTNKSIYLTQKAYAFSTYHLENSSPNMMCSDVQYRTPNLDLKYSFNLILHLSQSEFLQWIMLFSLSFMHVEKWI